MNAYRFIKEENEWYIDLPKFIENGGDRGDLQMVQGADKMLDIIAEDSDQVHLIIDRNLFQGSDKLTLIERCSPMIGGGIYNMEMYQGKKINQKMWLCAVVEFIFDDLPDEIFVKKVDKVSEGKISAAI
jgi:hypothetical protein